VEVGHCGWLAAPLRVRGEKLPYLDGPSDRRTGEVLHVGGEAGGEPAELGASALVEQEIPGRPPLVCSWVECPVGLGQAASELIAAGLRVGCGRELVLHMCVEGPGRIG